MTTEDIYPITDGVMDIAQQASNTIWRQYQQYGVERFDLEQSFYDWWCTHPGRVRNILGVDWDGEPIKDRRTSSRLFHQACKVMAAVGKQHKADLLGYNVRDEQFYGRKAVELLLPAIWDSGYREHGPERVQDVNAQHGFGKVKADPRTHNMWATMILDMESAYSRVIFGEHEEMAMQMYFSDGYSQNKIGEKLSVSQATVDRILSRAVSRIVDKLNGGHIPEVAGRVAAGDRKERINMEDEA